MRADLRHVIRQHLAAASLRPRAPSPQAPPGGRRHEHGLLPGLPHPLDVDIRQTSHEVLDVSAGGQDVTVCVGDCPDGCGQLIAWTETILPFNAATPAGVAAIITRSYPEVTA